MKPKIAQVIPVLRLKRDLHYFDYLIPPELNNQIKTGQLVEIPFRNKIIKGVILDLVESSKFESKKLKRIAKIIEHTPLLANWQLNLVKNLAQYYFVSMAVILKMLIPDIPKKPRVSQDKFLKDSEFLQATRENINIDQYYEAKNPVLLRYFKFSDKIQIYLNLILEVLKQNKQVLILVPTLSDLKMISQYLGDFKDETTVFLNNLPKNKYWQEWQKINKGETRIILGTRSAIFAPFKCLDLIIIDDEDNENHKQEEPNPRYHVKTIALKLRELIGSKIICTAMTPSLNSLHKVAQKDWQYLEINKPTEWPAIKIIDRQIEQKKGNYTIFSDELLSKIEDSLNKSKRVFLFLNRKGTATLVNCKDCGYLASCPICKLPLTYHASKELICHHCNHKQEIFLFCPKCNSPSIKITGTGTEKVEMEIKKIYPQAKILRLDLETPLHDKKIADFEIIIGTQYAFDYIKWQEINLIGVLNADTLLYLPDYRSAEKTFNLLVKLAILLADPQKELLIQTFRPENYIFQAIKSVDYRLFYKNELEERKALFYPPLGRLIKLIYQSIEFNGGQNEVNKIYNELKTKINADKIVVNSPLLAYTQQVRGRWRWQIILKILDEKLSLAFLNNLPEDVIIDPEPESLL